MHSTYLILASAFAFTATAGVCDSGLYKALAPLSSYPPAQSMCARRFPRSVVTITVTRSVQPQRRTEAARASSSAAKTTASTTTGSAAVSAANRNTRSTAPTSTRTTSAVRSTATPQSGSTTTTRTSASSSNTITVTRTSTSTTSARDSREAAWSSISAQAGAILSTFCSCAQPASTVTSYLEPPTPTTPTTTPIITEPPSSPPTPEPTCGISCSVYTIADMRGAPECQQFGAPCGYCAVNAGYGYRGVCAPCASQNQVCNADADCCNASDYCGGKGSGTYGWCSPRRARRRSNLELLGDLEDNSPVVV